MNKREQQRQERREQILKCSLDLMITQGYEAMKIRDIAEKLNISTGLFFNYFESKEKIYEELIRLGVSGPQSVLKLNVEGVDPLELFENMTKVIFQELKEYSYTAKMFVLMGRTMHLESAPDSVKKLISQMDTFTPIVQVIIRGQQLGEIKEGDPAALALAYWGAIQGIAEVIAIYPELPHPQGDWIVDILRK
jgi:AcrR family transcriptional regulator